MPNSYYTRTMNPQPTQRVGSNDLKSEFQSVEGGFDKVAADMLRTLKVPATTTDQLLNLTPASRANLVLAFDASGNPTAIAYGRYRGDWVTGTAYVVSDYFRDPTTKNIYAVVLAHTAGVLVDDVAAGKVRLSVNVADVEAAKSAAQAAEAGATAQVALAAAQAELATTNGAAQVALAAAQADLATTNGAAQVALAAAQAELATTNGAAQVALAAAQASNAALSAADSNAAKLAAQAAQAAAEATVATIPDGTINDAITSLTDVWSSQKVSTQLATKQATLVSGTSIKTLGGVSLLGAGDIPDPEFWQVGDVIQTSRTLSAPAWLPCDGGIYLQASYAALYAELGLIANVMPGEKLTNPAPTPPDLSRGCSWDSSGTYLAVASDTSPYLTVYQRSGSTLTKLANPATLPTGNATGCSWDASGTYLAVAHQSSPYITVYQRSGSTLTKLANPSPLPGSDAFGCSFSASAGLLAVAHTSAPYITVYKNLNYDEATQFATPLVSAGANLSAYIKA